MQRNEFLREKTSKTLSIDKVSNAFHLKFWLSFAFSSKQQMKVGFVLEMNTSFGLQK
jgi:hypothetical protein